MIDFLEDRLNELRRLYRDTGLEEYLHRYNEAHLIREQCIVDEIKRARAARRREERDAGPDAGDYRSTIRNG